MRNGFDIIGGVCNIRLFDKDGIVRATAICDAEDARAVSQHHWSYHSGGYAYCNKERVLLHRFITAPKGKMVDHINRNKLDCRRSNLRRCSNSENLRNRGPQANNKSGYKGVSYVKDRNKWTAHIRVNNKDRNLGNFSCRVAAAWAYNRAAEKLHGDFATLNTLTRRLL